MPGSSAFDIPSPSDPSELEAEAMADEVAGSGDYPTLSPLNSTAGEPDIGALVTRARSSPALPLHADLQGRMESRFGADFSRVRVHRDEHAQRAAAALTARAFTLGSDLFFGTNQYAPDTRPGLRLLAHELTHVAQQGGRLMPRRIARHAGAGPSCGTGHPMGANLNPPVTTGGKEIVYAIWGEWKIGDTSAAFIERTIRAWVTWRFGISSGKQYSDVLTYMLQKMTVAAEPTLEPGCQYWLGIDHNGYARIRALSGEIAREKGDDDKHTKQATAAEDPSGTEAPAGIGAQAAQPGAGKIGGTIGDFGFEPAQEAAELEKLPAIRIKVDTAVLKDPELAARYLKILEHYARRSLSDADRTAASNGLDGAEIAAIEDGQPLRRALGALFTQGWREFNAAGGSDKDKFMLLEELICEQFTRGNPTATSNRLEIGKGVPEKDILGIVERGLDILLYDDLGVPLPGFAGVGFRDKGYTAARGADKWGFNIANVKDAGLRALLNSLRQTFGDPTRIAIAGAEMYFKHIEKVNKETFNGLSNEVIQKFEDMLPVFVGFLAGHGVSTFLARVPNPYVAGVGLALKGLLVGAGYVLQIDFGAGALSRLMLAAAYLSKFEQNDKGELSEISEDNVKLAAGVLREMIAEIAVMFATAALGKLLSRASPGGKQLKIECTHCDLKGPASAEAKAEAKPEVKAEAKPEAKAAEHAEPKPEAEPAPESQTAQQKAAEKLEQLKHQKAKVEEDLAALRTQREALREARDKAVQEKRASVAKEDQASSKEEAHAARTAAREAYACEQVANSELEKLPSDVELFNQKKKLEADVALEGIKADPNSRGHLPCFARGTPVQTPRGPRLVESLLPGDEVWAWDFGRQRAIVRPVVQVHRGKTQRWVCIHGRRGSVWATPGHRFFSHNLNEWMEAARLAPSTRLLGLDSDDSHQVNSLQTIELGHEEATYNLSIGGCPTYFVGPGWLVHNAAVDIGLGGNYIIYRATNPAFPGKAYIGQTTELNAQGNPRGDVERQGEHRKLAAEKLKAEAEKPGTLSKADKDFYEFMRDAELEPLVKGIATKSQADYLEQHNLDIERADPSVQLMNRREQITSEAHRKQVVDEIMKDPAVLAKGHCP
jgi:hypothetical protein